MYIWAVGILAAGQSSTMTGCYSGQFAMEVSIAGTDGHLCLTFLSLFSFLFLSFSQGFLNLQWSRWKRVLLTRTVAIIPTFLVAYYSNIEDMTGMNDYLNAVMSLQLPFALLPTIAFTSSKAIMGEFANGVVTIIAALLLATVVIGINTYYVVDTVTVKFSGEWPALLAVAIFGLFYLLLCLYLFLHMLASIGICRSFTTNSVRTLLP